MATLREYMLEEKPTNRLTILKVGLLGAFCGICLATVFYLLVIS